MNGKSAGDIIALITAAGDILVGDGSGSLTKLTKGANGTLMIVDDNGDVIWSSALKGVVTAQTNTSYDTAQLRNVIESTADASGGNNGDIWLKYTA